MAETVTFDDVAPASLPAAWQAGMTGSGSPRWGVVEEPTAPSPTRALKQSGEATFPWCVKQDVSLQDGFVEVKFKPVAGREDQAGGVIWRFRDANNYYITRANALEDNVVLYKVENGKRTSLDIKGRHGGYGVKKEVPADRWSTLRVTYAGPLFAVFLNGEKLFEVEDSTFGAAGAVGVWTKADSATLFDDFRYGSTP